jgi:hypothetical protein
MVYFNDIRDDTTIISLHGEEKTEDDTHHDAAPATDPTESFVTLANADAFPNIVRYEPVFDCNNYDIYRDTDACRRMETWKRFKIDDVSFYVSSEGKIRSKQNFFSVTEGEHAMHTRFRYLPINGTKYFIHDIVWRAFYGQVPSGWEVGHKEHVMDLYESSEEDLQHMTYPNSIDSLDIYPTMEMMDQ